MSTSAGELLELRNVDTKACKHFTVKLETYARVVNVHDGDTITVIFKFGGSYCKFNVRLDGIDTAELHGELSNIARKAKDRLAEFIGNSDNIVWLQCKGLDKYGRVLADVWDINKEVCFGKKLVDEHLAYEYHGKKKLTVADQLKLLQTT